MNLNIKAILKIGLIGIIAIGFILSAMTINDNLNNKSNLNKQIVFKNVLNKGIKELKAIDIKSNDKKAIKTYKKAIKNNNINTNNKDSKSLYLYDEGFLSTEPSEQTSWDSMEEGEPVNQLYKYNDGSLSTEPSEQTSWNTIEEGEAL